MKPRIFRSACEGIAEEEAMLAAGRPAVMLWQAEENAIVVPRPWARRSGFEAACERADAKSWPVLTRPSGGGAVPQGPGTLNLTMVAPVAPGLGPVDCYRELCGAVAEALSRFSITTDFGRVDGALCDGAWNVTAGGRKLVGTAQRWRPNPQGLAVALMHGAIMLERPDGPFWPVLAHIEKTAGSACQPQPDVHAALRDLLPENMSVQLVIGALARAAEDRLGRISPSHQKAA